MERQSAPRWILKSQAARCQHPSSKRCKTICWHILHFWPTLSQLVMVVRQYGIPCDNLDVCLVEPRATCRHNLEAKPLRTCALRDFPCITRTFTWLLGNKLNFQLPCISTYVRKDFSRPFTVPLQASSLPRTTQPYFSPRYVQETLKHYLQCQRSYVQKRQ